MSVVLPAAEFAYLRRALTSVLDQTMPDLEIVLVDDGSSDAVAREAIHELANRDARLRIFRNERRLGVSSTLNRGLSQARGKWIARLDADDIWLPERLERMLSQAEGADVVSDDIYRMAADGQTGYSCLKDKWHASLVVREPHWLTPREMVRHHLGFLKPIFRRDFVERHALRYNPELPVQEDFHLYFALLQQGARWLQLPEGYYLWYRHAGSLSQSAWSDTDTARRVLDAGLRKLAESRAQDDVGLAAALEEFLEEERLNAFVLALRSYVRARRFTAALRSIPRWLHGPADLSLLARLTVRHQYARFERTRRLVRAVPGARGVMRLEAAR